MPDAFALASHKENEGARARAGIIALSSAGLILGVLVTAAPSTATALHGLELRATRAPANELARRSPASSTPTFMSVFVAPSTQPALVPAPSANVSAAFAALNTLLRAQTRVGQALVGMRVGLDRAQAATAAGAPLWVVRQANVSAQYALAASDALEALPGLQAAVGRAFVADKMTVSLTAAQSATAKARLLRALPASFSVLAKLAAAAYQPATVPEVARARAAILGTASFERAVAGITPEALVLPANLVPESATAAETGLATALRSYAEGILQPLPARGLLGTRGRLVPAGEGCGPSDYEVGENLLDANHWFEGGSAIFKDLGGEAGEGAAESSEFLGAAFGYAFAAFAFWQAGQQFNLGPDGGGGGGGGGGSGGGGGGGGEGGGGGCGPGNGGSWGDPHEETFSGAGYGFQAAGEFTLVKSTTDDLDVQVRQQPFPGSASIAIDTAAAMRVAGTTVELAGNASGHLRLWVDGKAVSYSSWALVGGGNIASQGPGQATVTWPDGTTVIVTSIATIAAAHGRGSCNSGDAIDVMVTVPRSRFGHLMGLLGDPGAPASTLVGGDGATYKLDQLAQPWGSAHNFDVLYHQFAKSWRVSRQSSLFYYPPGASTASFSNPAFPSKALTIASLAPKSASSAESDCRAEGIINPSLLADCVYDVGLTGGACFGGAEAAVQAAGSGPTASDLPQSSGSIPSASTTTTTVTSGTTTTSLPATATTQPAGPGPSSRASALRFPPILQTRPV